VIGSQKKEIGEPEPESVMMTDPLEANTETVKKAIIIGIGVRKVDFVFIIMLFSEMSEAASLPEAAWFASCICDVLVPASRQVNSEAAPPAASQGIFLQDFHPKQCEKLKRKEREIISLFWGSRGVDCNTGAPDEKTD
jgi:hypothetical protein